MYDRTDETLYWKKTINQHQYICNTCKDACHANCIKSQPFLVSMPKVSKIHSWLCDRCSLAELPFYRVSSLNDSLVDKSLDVVDAVVNIDHEGDQLSPMEWFNCNINGYYKNNLKIAHLNVNSIFDRSEEVINHTRQLCF